MLACSQPLECLGLTRLFAGHHLQLPMIAYVEYFNTNCLKMVFLRYLIPISLLVNILIYMTLSKNMILIFNDLNFSIIIIFYLEIFIQPYNFIWKPYDSIEVPGFEGPYWKTYKKQLQNIQTEKYHHFICILDILVTL